MCISAHTCAMAEARGGLGKDRFLDLMTPEARAELEAAGRLVRFAKGAVLYNEGDRTGRVLIMQTGRVKVSRPTPDGKEVVLAIREAGDLLGEQSAFDGRDHSATATVLEPVEARVLQNEEFKRFLESQPAAAITLLEMLSRRLREADEKLLEFTAHDAAGRVARRLVELAERFGKEADGAITIDVGLSQEELASYTASSRGAVSKALQTLKARGLIETLRNQVVIKDLDELRRRAGM